MIKKTYLKLFVITVIGALVAFLVFYGCKEAADAEETAKEEMMEEEAMEEEQIAEEAAGESDSEESVDVEEDSVETTQVEESAPPAQIIDIFLAEVFQIMENDKDYLIVDVRTKEEYDSGHLEGAILLPVQELKGRLDELPMDKPIIVYCRSGARSRNAANILTANGFTMVYDMGGINSWIEEAYPVIVEE